MNKETKKIESSLKEIENVLNSSRVKLSKDVFEERHLPTILKNNGVPTKELQKELILLAGGETKVIDIVNDNGETILSLPPAIGTGNTISYKGDLRNLNKTLSQLADSNTTNNDKEIKTGKLLLDKKNDIINEVKTKNPWNEVLTYFDKKVETKKTQPKKAIITFDYD